MLVPWLNLARAPVWLGVSVVQRGHNHLVPKPCPTCISNTYMIRRVKTMTDCISQPPRDDNCDGSPLLDKGGMRLAPRRPRWRNAAPCREIVNWFNLFSSLLVGGATILCVSDNGKGSPLPPPRALLFQVQALRWLGSIPTETVPGPSGDLSRNST